MSNFPNMLNADEPLLFSNRGQANGVASLDASGKVPTSELPFELMEFLGNWDASTNTPTLSNTDVGAQGNTYRVSVAGTVDFGAGPITFTVGDWCYNTGVIWEVGIQTGSQDLPTTLANGNSTGANNISIDSGQSIIYNNSGFTATINESSLIGNILLTLPNSSGTFALTSDIPTVAGVYLPLAGGTMVGDIQMGGDLGGNNNLIKWGGKSIGIQPGTGSLQINGSAANVIITGDQRTEFATGEKGIRLRSVSGSFFGDLDYAGLTDFRTWNLPNSSGTIALTTDIPTVLNNLLDVVTGLPLTPTNADDGKLLYFDVASEKWESDDSVTFGTVVEDCKTSVLTGSIPKGTPVYLAGYDNDLIIVEAADASDPLKMPCIGITSDNIDDTNPKKLMTFGKLQGVDTSSNPQGTIFYVAPGGGLTTTRPTGATDLIQRVAKNLKQGNPGGQLFVFNTFRVAGLPNLATGMVWIGDANNNPTQVSLPSSGVESLTGTANRISITGTATDPIVDIASTYVGQTSITTLGTITTGVWNGTTISETNGGTGLSAYTTGDVLFASATNTLSKLAIGSSGTFLRSNNTTVEWSGVSFANSAVAGDIIYASGTNNYDNLSVGTNGQVLTLVGGLPSWSTPIGGGVASVTGTANRISITGTATDPIVDIASTYVGQTSITTLGTITTGVWNGTTISETNGGTGLSAYTTGDVLFASATNTLSKLAIGSLGQFLTVDASGVPTWSTIVIPSPATLAATLLLGNTTSGTNITVSTNDNITFEGAVGSTPLSSVFISSPVLGGNVVISLPSQSGTLALVGDDLQTLEEVLSTGNSTGANDVVMSTLTGTRIFRSDNATTTNRNAISFIDGGGSQDLIAIGNPDFATIPATSGGLIGVGDSANLQYQITSTSGYYTQLDSEGWFFFTQGVGTPPKNVRFGNDVRLAMDSPDASGNPGILTTANLTANRTYTFQDGSGTVAFLSDIAGAVWSPNSVPLGSFLTSGAAFQLNSGAGLQLSFSSTADDQIFFNDHLGRDGNSDYDGSDLAMRITCKLSANAGIGDTVNLQVSYSITPLGSLSSVSTQLAQQITVVTGKLADELFEITLPTMTGVPTGDTLFFSLLRNSQGGGSDSFPGAFEIVSMELIKV